MYNVFLIPCKEASQIVHMFVETCLNFALREASEQEVHSEAPIDTPGSKRTLKPRWPMA